MAVEALLELKGAVVAISFEWSVADACEVCVPSDSVDIWARLYKLKLSHQLADEGDEQIVKM